MSNGVEFDFDNEPRAVVQTKTPAMVKLVIKLSGGLIKDSTQANLALLALSFLMFALSYFLIFTDGNEPYRPTQEEINRMMNMNVPNVAPPVK